MSDDPITAALCGELRQRAARVQAAEAVLRQHYETDMPHAELLRLYGEARGESLTREAMQQHARKLNLHRPVGNSRSVAGSVPAVSIKF